MKEFAHNDDDKNVDQNEIVVFFIRNNVIRENVDYQGKGHQGRIQDVINADN